MEATVVIVRFLQTAAAMIVCGSGLFFIYAQRPLRIAWARALLLVVALVGATGTFGWLLLQTISLSDGPLSAAALLDVMFGTGFGRASGVRLLAFFIAAGSVLKSIRLSVAAVAGAVASASLAWSGHGASDGGVAGVVHQGADVIHLMAAAIWTGALVGLVWLAAEARADAVWGMEGLRRGLERFSGIGPLLVSALVASGLLNSWFVIGPAHALDLPATPYGQLLLLKLAAFVGMLGLAALNRWVLTPRLDGDMRPIALSVIAETTLALLIIGLIASLGTLSPPASA